MNEMDALERTLQRVRELPPEERERIRLVLDEMLAEPDDAAAFERETQDPEYRAYVAQRLARAEEQIAAGKFAPAREVFPALIERFKAKNGI